MNQELTDEQLEKFIYSLVHLLEKHKEVFFKGMKRWGHDSPITYLEMMIDIFGHPPGLTSFETDTQLGSLSQWSKSEVPDCKKGDLKQYHRKETLQ